MNVSPSTNRSNALDPTARHRFLTGIRQCDLEVLLVMCVMVGDLRPIPQMDCEVIIHGFIVEEIFLDHLPPISQAQHELAVTVMGIELHDVPKYRFLADQDHRFWSELSLFAKTSSLAAAKNDDFQCLTSRWIGIQRPRIEQ